ncbi:hypothetical protein AA100600_1683 [Gluconobacter thailandicus F149-1 = NBRC 100600]|nr:hypothetical protein AA100600_1683 [Gluconobacter thailandicus F149-1 = NBRC 100600]
MIRGHENNATNHTAIQNLHDIFGGDGRRRMMLDHDIESLRLGLIADSKQYVRKNRQKGLIGKIGCHDQNGVDYTTAKVSRHDVGRIAEFCSDLLNSAACFIINPLRPGQGATDR